MSRTCGAFLSLVLLSVSAPAVAQDDRNVLRLPIGDPARKARTVPLLLDAVIDTSTGEPVPLRSLPDRLADVRVLLVGEAHTSAEAHEVQRRVIEVLSDAGRPLFIGLEMLPYTAQEALDGWVAGRLDEHALLDASSWYENWGYSWQYYRQIFLLARERRLPMFALNVPRDVVTAVRARGLSGLTAAEAAHVPPDIRVEDADHLALLKASIGSDGGVHGETSDEGWSRLLAAQATWDASMAYRAVKALEERGTPDTLMVVLAGTGHVTYGVGIERQLRGRLDGRVASLVPVAIGSTPGAPREVQASYANYLWGVPSERWPAYPTLGISTRPSPGGNGLQVIFVAHGSAAGRAGIETGDVLLTADDAPLRGREALSRVMDAKRWGDEVVIGLRRGDRDVSVSVPLRRVDLPPDHGRSHVAHP